MNWNDWVTIALVLPGAFISLTGAVGILRFPDFYSRLHPAGMPDTLGQLLILSGLAFQVFDGTTTTPWLTMGRLLIIFTVLFITAPTSTHAITKAAHLDGLKPWTKPEDAADSKDARIEAAVSNPANAAKTMPPTEAGHD